MPRVALIQKMPKKRATKMKKNHVSCVKCLMSFVMCHMVLVTCHMSHVTCHLSLVTNTNSYSHRPYPCKKNESFFKTKQSMQTLCKLICLLVSQCKQYALGPEVSSPLGSMGSRRGHTTHTQTNGHYDL